jgi:hypothetical protein
MRVTVPGPVEKNAIEKASSMLLSGSPDVTQYRCDSISGGSVDESLVRLTEQGGCPLGDGCRVADVAKLVKTTSPVFSELPLM